MIDAPNLDHPYITPLWQTGGRSGRDRVADLCVLRTNDREIFAEVAEESGIKRLPDGTPYAKTSFMEYSFRDRGDSLEYTTGFNGYIFPSNTGRAHRDYTGTHEQCLSKLEQRREGYRSRLRYLTAANSSKRLSEQTIGHLLGVIRRALANLHEVDPKVKTRDSYYAAKKHLNNLVTILTEEGNNDAQ